MQYLAASFLRWVVTSCAMWGSLTCLSTPSFAARTHRVVHRGAAAHQVRQVHQDRRGPVALRVYRVRTAVRDRSEAADPLDRALEVPLDPEEARDLRARAVVLAPVDHQVRVAPLGRAKVDHRSPAAARAVPAHLVRPGLRVPVVHRVQNHLGAVARAAADRRVAANNLARAQVLRDPAAVTLVQVAPEIVDQVQAADPLETATAVVQDRVDLDLALEADPVRAPVASVQAALVAPGNLTDQAVLAVQHQAAAALVRRAVAVARVTSSGMAIPGLGWVCPTRVFHRTDHFTQHAFARAQSRAVRVRSLGKFSTQDVSTKHDK